MELTKNQIDTAEERISKFKDRSIEIKTNHREKNY